MPVLNSPVADMVSDGQQFRLAMFQPKKRFLRGTNLKDYERMAASELRDVKDPDVVKAGGLVNMRPQHLTDAFLSTVEVGEQTQVFREEVSWKSPARVSAECSRLHCPVCGERTTGQMELRANSGLIGLKRTLRARQQIFDNGGGKLASDISYKEWGPVANGKLEWPAIVVIDRFNDGYRLDGFLERELIEPDMELPATAFVLENTEKFEEIDMDAPRKSSAGQAQKTPQPRLPNR